MRPLAMLLAAFAIAGCGVTASSPPSSTAPPGESPETAQPLACHDVDIRLPSGEPVDLTGTWHGDSGTYWTFSQVGDCIWATALDRYRIPMDDRDYYWLWYLQGALQSDFTIPVQFAVSPLQAGGYEAIDPGYGHTRLALDPATMVLRKLEDTCVEPCGPGELSLQTLTWTLVRPTVILPAPTPD